MFAGRTCLMCIPFYLLTNLIKGSDACETAARVFKCGVDKDVVGMTSLIETSAANAANDVKFHFGYR